ncbi:MFS transporter, partial [Kitasatospora sp. NPDC093558]|uniref:MFS transporter n=1 Tax=Kitasatospora sp. NPDC093558 TaxID=3155201 RepID=UPI003424E7B9
VGAASAASVLVGVQIAGGLGRVVLAAWSDRSRHGRFRTVAGSMTAVIAGTALLMTPAGHVPAVAVVDFLWLGFFGIGWYGPWVAHLSESAPPDRAGFTLGAVMAVNQIAVIASPPLLGLISDLTHGYTAAWGVLSVVTAAALALGSRSSGPQRTSSTTWADSESQTP